MFCNSTLYAKALCRSTQQWCRPPYWESTAKLLQNFKHFSIQIYSLCSSVSCSVSPLNLMTVLIYYTDSCLRWTPVIFPARNTQIRILLMVLLCCRTHIGQLFTSQAKTLSCQSHVKTYHHYLGKAGRVWVCPLQLLNKLRKKGG